MANLIIPKVLEPEERLALMREDALYDVADDDGVCVPDLASIREELKAKPGPPKVPKIFVSNDCSFNCAYCGCRATRDKEPYTGEPREIAKLALSAAKGNGHGVFITSAICKNADHTEALIVETLRVLRRELGYRGYLHAKIMPGADPELIRQAGLYANRLSVNIEVAKSEGYERIARNKNRDNILTPMGRISGLIRAAKEERGPYAPRFASSQTTQLMAGSTEERDSEILRLARAMYDKYNLARVYYTSFQYRHHALGYDLPLTATPGWRMRRLYQADRLMQVYGFTPEEIAPESEPDLCADLDPKAAWALRHLELYPIEVNKADYEELIRIPGIGVTYAKRIIKARKYCKITHDVLRALGVSLKRSRHFLTCGGRFEGERGDAPEERRALLVTPPLPEEGFDGANGAEG